MKLSTNIRSTMLYTAVMSSETAAGMEKRRIMGNKGHLSNDSAGRLLGDILHDGFKKALLGHLSRENNYAELAYETVRLEVTMGENAYQGADFDIAVADRDKMSEVIYI